MSKDDRKEFCLLLQKKVLHDDDGDGRQLVNLYGGIMMIVVGEGGRTPDGMELCC